MCSKGKYWNVKEAVLSPTPQDIAYLAGFLEGDGYFSRNRTTHIVNAQQKDPWILQKLQQLFGGSLGQIHRQGVNKATYYRWAVSGARARGVMMTVYKFMSPYRQNQIKEALYVY